MKATPAVLLIIALLALGLGPRMAPAIQASAPDTAPANMPSGEWINESYILEYTNFSTIQKSAHYDFYEGYINSTHSTALDMRTAYSIAPAGTTQMLNDYATEQFRKSLGEIFPGVLDNKNYTASYSAQVVPASLSSAPIDDYDPPIEFEGQAVVQVLPEAYNYSGSIGMDDLFFGLLRSGAHFSKELSYNLSAGHSAEFTLISIPGYTFSFQNSTQPDRWLEDNLAAPTMADSAVVTNTLIAVCDTPNIAPDKKAAQATLDLNNMPLAGLNISLDVFGELMPGSVAIPNSISNLTTIGADAMRMLLEAGLIDEAGIYGEFVEPHILELLNEIRASLGNDSVNLSFALNSSSLTGYDIAVMDYTRPVRCDLASGPFMPGIFEGQGGVTAELMFAILNNGGRYPIDFTTPRQSNMSYNTTLYLPDKTTLENKAPYITADSGNSFTMTAPQTHFTGYIASATAAKNNSEEITVNLELDWRTLDAPRFNATIHVASLNTSGFDEQLFGIDGLNYVSADVIRLAYQSASINLDEITNSTIEPLLALARNSLEDLLGANVSLEFEWDTDSLNYPADPDTIGTGPPLIGHIYSSPIFPSRLNISGVALNHSTITGFLNAGARLKIEIPDFDPGYPATMDILTPRGIELFGVWMTKQNMTDAVCHHLWDVTEYTGSEVFMQSTTAPWYTQSDAVLNATVDIFRVESSATAVDMYVNIDIGASLSVIDSGVLGIDLPDALVFDYVNADAIRLAVSPGIADRTQIDEYILNQTRQIEEKLSSALGTEVHFENTGISIDNDIDTARMTGERPIVMMMHALAVADLLDYMDLDGNDAGVPDDETVSLPPSNSTAMVISCSAESAVPGTDSKAMSFGAITNPVYTFSSWVPFDVTGKAGWVQNLTIILPEHFKLMDMIVGAGVIPFTDISDDQERHSVSFVIPPNDENYTVEIKIGAEIDLPLEQLSSYVNLIIALYIFWAGLILIGFVIRWKFPKIPQEEFG